jgi:3-deoxy-7-phosphoheptulonate synthase
MVVVMEERASEAQIEQVVARLVEMGMDVHRSTGVTRTVLGAVGQGHPDKALIELLDGVHEVLRISEPYKLASKTFKPEGTIVSVGDVRIGGDEVIVMAGPCSAESEPQVRAAAAAVKRAGAKIFRGGAFKPRSSPYSFQGLGEEGLRLLRDASNAENLKLITEVMDLSQIEVIDKYTDIFQVGARNMQNFTLLRELGHARKPVLIKRGISATIEWLLSAEYVLRREQRRHPVRQHPCLRDRHAQHVRHLGDPCRQEAEPSADRGRPESRRRPPRHGCPDGARRGRRRSRRPDHRGALRSGSRVE